MPPGVVKTDRDEYLWERPKDWAEREGKGGLWPYVMGIFLRASKRRDGKHRKARYKKVTTEEGKTRFKKYYPKKKKTEARKGGFEALLLKAKGYPVGTQRDRRGGTYKKVAQGKWERVTSEARASGVKVVESKSPLDYRTGGTVRRIALKDPSATSHDDGGSYFKEKGLLGFIDYETYGGNSVYIHYTGVRGDQRGKGYARKLVDTLYQKFAGADLVHWGKIMEPAMEKLYRERRQDPEGTPTHGKIWTSMGQATLFGGYV